MTCEKWPKFKEIGTKNIELAKVVVKEKKILARTLLASYSSESVEQLWSSFKSSVNEGLKKFVPCKKIGAKSSLPWVLKK